MVLEFYIYIYIITALPEGAVEGDGTFSYLNNFEKRNFLIHVKCHF